MTDLSIFSARLKNARIMKGLSMDELCSSMGNLVSKMTISKYENGLLAPNSGSVIALITFLDHSRSKWNLLSSAKKVLSLKKRE